MLWFVKEIIATKKMFVNKSCIYLNELDLFLLPITAWSLNVFVHSPAQSTLSAYRAQREATDHQHIEVVWHANSKPFKKHNADK